MTVHLTKHLAEAGLDESAVEAISDDVARIAEDRARQAMWLITRRAMLVVTIVVLITGVGLYRSEHAADEATAAVAAGEQEAIERQVDGCVRSNEFRTFLREDYERRGRPLDAQAIRTTAEYLALPANVRPFVDALIAQTVADRLQAADQGEEYIAIFPIVDCDELRDTLQAEQAAG